MYIHESEHARSDQLATYTHIYIVVLVLGLLGAPRSMGIKFQRGASKTSTARPRGPELTFTIGGRAARQTLSNINVCPP